MGALFAQHYRGRCSAMGALFTQPYRGRCGAMGALFTQPYRGRRSAMGALSPIGGAVRLVLLGRCGDMGHSAL